MIEKTDAGERKPGPTDEEALPNRLASLPNLRAVVAPGDAQVGTLASAWHLGAMCRSDLRRAVLDLSTKSRSSWVEDQAHHQTQRERLRINQTRTLRRVAGPPARTANQRPGERRQTG